MPPPGSPPSLRSSQRQVIAYLPPELVDGLRSAAASRRLTLREVLALAINGELATMGFDKVLTPLQVRQFKRVQGAAAPRDERCDTAVRRGRKAVAGWFDRKEAERLRDVARETGRTVQGIAESGAFKLAETWRSEDPQP